VRGAAIGLGGLLAVTLVSLLNLLVRGRRRRKREARYTLLEPLILTDDVRSSTRSSAKRLSRGIHLRTPERAPTAPPAYFDVIPLIEDENACPPNRVGSYRERRSNIRRSMFALRRIRPSGS